MTKPGPQELRRRARRVPHARTAGAESTGPSGPGVVPLAVEPAAGRVRVFVRRLLPARVWSTRDRIALGIHSAVVLVASVLLVLAQRSDGSDGSSLVATGLMLVLIVLGMPWSGPLFAAMLQTDFTEDWHAPLPPEAVLAALAVVNIALHAALRHRRARRRPA